MTLKKGSQIDLKDPEQNYQQHLQPYCRNDDVYENQTQQQTRNSLCYLITNIFAYTDNYNYIFDRMYNIYKQCIKQNDTAVKKLIIQFNTLIIPLYCHHCYAQLSENEYKDAQNYNFIYLFAKNCTFNENKENLQQLEIFDWKTQNNLHKIDLTLLELINQIECDCTSQVLLILQKQLAVCDITNFTYVFYVVDYLLRKGSETLITTFYNIEQCNLFNKRYIIQMLMQSYDNYSILTELRDISVNSLFKSYFNCGLQQDRVINLIHVIDQDKMKDVMLSVDKWQDDVQDSDQQQDQADSEVVQQQVQQQVQQIQQIQQVQQIQQDNEQNQAVTQNNQQIKVQFAEQSNNQLKIDDILSNFQIKQEKQKQEQKFNQQQIVNEPIKFNFDFNQQKYDNVQQEFVTQNIFQINKEASNNIQTNILNQSPHVSSQNSELTIGSLEAQSLPQQTQQEIEKYAYNPQIQEQINKYTKNIAQQVVEQIIVEKQVNKLQQEFIQQLYKQWIRRIDIYEQQKNNEKKYEQIKQEVAKQYQLNQD